jgi:signal peptidase I
MNKKIELLFDNIKTIFYALIIAILIRSLLIQPFYIPSSSMEPTLLIGDRIFVSKLAYGYSKHSFPFSPNFFKDRFFYKTPSQGDLVVFKTPADNRTDYIKRLIALPGDQIQFVEGEIFLNNKIITRTKVEKKKKVRCGQFSFEVNTYEETLPNGTKHIAVYNKQGTLMNTKKFIVPKNHFFLLGDNRDCSKDSRYLNDVGYVNAVNLVGQAKIIFFSNDTVKSRLLKFWNIKNSFRFNRFFKIIK